MTENAFCALLKYCIISSADVRVSCGTCTMRQIREKFQRPLLIGYLIVDLAKTHKARRGSGIWPKYSAGFGKTLTGYGIWLLPRGSEFAKTWAWMRNGNDKWYSGYWWKKSDAGFLVKREWKCGFRTASFQTLYSKITVLEAFAISLPLILGPVYMEVGDPR